MKNEIFLLSILLAFLLVSQTAPSKAQEPITIGIVVTGKQPGPPLWRVTNEDNTLYIFVWLSPIPKNIFWESQRVEKVIAEAQEYIPLSASNVSISPLVLLNPFNIINGISLGKRITRNADKATLEKVLPTELYQRFSDLKAEYFPNNKKIESMRPYVVSQQLLGLVQNEADLKNDSDVGKKIRRMVRRNRGITVTEVKYDMKLEGGFKTLSQRIENLMNSLP